MGARGVADISGWTATIVGACAKAVLAGSDRLTGIPGSAVGGVRADRTVQNTASPVYAQVEGITGIPAPGTVRQCSKYRAGSAAVRFAGRTRATAFVTFLAASAYVPASRAVSGRSNLRAFPGTVQFTKSACADALVACSALRTCVPASRAVGIGSNQRAFPGAVQFAKRTCAGTVVARSAIRACVPASRAVRGGPEQRACSGTVDLADRVAEDASPVQTGQDTFFLNFAHVAA